MSEFNKRRTGIRKIPTCGYISRGELLQIANHSSRSELRHGGLPARWYQYAAFEKIRDTGRAK
jgi:hypothetical protein